MQHNWRRIAFRTVSTTAVVYGASYFTVRVKQRLRSTPIVVFATGGAGSHVFPAVAMATELCDKGIQCAFLGSSRGLEVHLAPQHGFPLHCITAVKWQQPLKRAANAINLFKFPLCLAQSLWALVCLAPDVVVGLAAGTSVPPCVAAAALGIPLLLYEPNALAGRGTQALHGVASHTLLAYEGAGQGLALQDRCEVVGPVVRREFLAAPGRTNTPTDSPPHSFGPAARQRRHAREALGLPTRGGIRVLLVLGGPEGCGYLNCAVNNALPQLTSVPGLHVLWQTGPKQYVAYAAGAASKLPGITCVPCLPDVATAMVAADLVLSRAGASLVSELGARGTPAVLVPSPAEDESQQTANARVLEAAGRAVVVPQHEVDDGGLATRLLPLLAPDGKQLAELRRGGHPYPHLQLQQELRAAAGKAFPDGGAAATHGAGPEVVSGCTGVGAGTGGAHWGGVGMGRSDGGEPAVVRVRRAVMQHVRR